MGLLSNDMKNRARAVAEFMDRDFPRIVKVEALNHFKQSFVNEGFTDNRLQKWKPRATKDSSGRDMTRYKTNRVGRPGGLTKYGRTLDGRPILTGHKSGGNKLRNSLRARLANRQVIIYTHKSYAERHNEGTEGMPQRQFMGPSRALDKKVEAKIDKQLNKIFK